MPQRRRELEDEEYRPPNKSPKPRDPIDIEDFFQEEREVLEQEEQEGE